MRYLLSTIFVLSNLIFSLPLYAESSLVTPAFIQEQKKLTNIKTLSNGVTVIFREVPGSDIIHLEAAWHTGSADLAEGQKTKNSLAFETMAFGSKDYPKAKLYKTTETYSFALGCSGGIETSSCQLETISDYLNEGLDLWSSIVLHPTFEDQDINLVRQRLQADYKNQLQNPDAAVNTVVNSVFYPAGHPYRLQPEESIQEITKFSSKDLLAYHNEISEGAKLIIAVVGPAYSDTLFKKVDEKFRHLNKGKPTGRVISGPAFDKNKNFTLTSRSVPTAYIRAKFNAPAVTDKRTATSSLLFEIFNEELGDEVRTKRSLSYATHAHILQLSTGIGIWSSTTSKPKETLETIAMVIKRLKDKKLSQQEVDEYKNVFATSYYLTQETHDALASGLIQSWMYFGTTDRLYNLPLELQKVTAEEIHILGKEILKNFRVGVIADSKTFKKDWVKPVQKF